MHRGLPWATTIELVTSPGFQWRGPFEYSPSSSFQYFLIMKQYINNDECKENATI